MTTTVIAPPTDPVVPLELLRAQCKLVVPPGRTHPEDPLLQMAAASARRMAQHQTGRAVGQQTIELVCDGFPAGAIVLPLGPAQSVQSVMFLAAEPEGMVERTVPIGNYMLTEASGVPTVLPLMPWPAAASAPGAVRVRYVAGDVTVATQQAIMLIVAHYYRHRQAVTDRETHQLLLGVNALFDVDRVWTL